MPLLQNEVICITGASRGVGECLAHCLAEEGAKKLILVAEEEQGICDLADPKAVQVNAMAPMRLVRALAPKMADKGHGTIICIGDVEAYHTGSKHGAYAASKYTLRGFCKSSYEALRGKGIRVMNIAAGNVAGTAMAQQTGKQAGQGAVAPEDVAEAVLLPFRCSANCVPEEIVLKAAQPGKA